MGAVAVTAFLFLAAPLLSTLTAGTNSVPFMSAPASTSYGVSAIRGGKLDFCAGPTYCAAAADADLKEQVDALLADADEECSALVKDALCKMICSPSVLADYSPVGSAVAMARALPQLLCGVPSSPRSESPGRRRTANALCLEKVSGGSFVDMVPHTDGTDRVFLASQEGRIWLASVPAPGSGATIHIPDGAGPILDIRDRVHYDEDSALGLRGFALHPEFSTNGRLFVASTCDSASPACGGAGECWVPVPGNSLRPCRFVLVVDEYRLAVQGGGNHHSKDKPYEARRMFSIGLAEPRTPYSFQHHGGQILFRTTEGKGYLYLTTGIEFVSSKNKMPFLGNILRFDVDNSTSKVQVYAMGAANPSRCSFDSARPWRLYCAGVDQRRYEKVHLVSDCPGSQSNTSSAIVVSHRHPAPGTMPLIVGGCVYWGSADLSLVGSYLHMYGHDVWVTREITTGHYTSTRISNVRCSTATPLSCRGIDGQVRAVVEDNSKDVYVLTTRGVYRIVHPDLCGAPSPSQAMHIWYLCVFVALMYVLYKACSLFLPDSGCCTGCCNGFCGGCCTHNYYYGADQQPHQA